MRYVGGPFDGQDIDGPFDGQDIDVESIDLDTSRRPYIVTVEGHAGRYVRWFDGPDDYDPDWFIKGKPEPLPPERYYRWQEPGAFDDNPAVRSLRTLMDTEMGGFR